MKYYVIAGEASGDLHASHLMRSIMVRDAEASFRFFGGDEMTRAVGERGVRVKHYRELAYMGFIPVLLHLPTILRNMSLCKRDIVQWQPDVVILVDYAGFNLNIAKFLRTLRKGSSLPTIEGWCGAPVYYYIAPKIWAWKEYRIKNFKRDVDEMFCILPFEKEFFEGKHHYPIHYVGNPTADEVREFRKQGTVPLRGIDASDQRPIIALLAGSRRQEIKDNLPAMLEATRGMRDYRLIIAGAPGIEPEHYGQFLDVLPQEERPAIVHGQTYALLSQATAALVTSGTATLETALFDVPQVVCYKTPVPRLCRWGFEHILKVRYISLVNLIADSEVVPELFADRFCIDNIRRQLLAILPGGEGRAAMLRDYEEVHRRLGDLCAPDNAAEEMLRLLK